MTEQVTIAPRFRGPPDSANGGYACGVVARALPPGAAEVTLRSPPPLDLPLSLAETDDGVELRDGEALVASGRSVPAPGLAPPAAVPLEEAEAARAGSPMRTRHPYPTCFVCGPKAEDGLGVTCGHVQGRGDVVAAPFATAEWMADSEGNVRPELVWSVLDCPGGIAEMLSPGAGIAVLGRLTAELRAPIPVGSDYVAIGWTAGREGRKAHAGTAVLDRSGTPLAVGRATWIEVAADDAARKTRA